MNGRTSPARRRCCRRTRTTPDDPAPPHSRGVAPSLLRRFAAAVCFAFCHGALGFVLLQILLALLSWQFARFHPLTILVSPILAAEASWSAMVGMPPVTMLAGAVAARFVPSRRIVLLVTLLAASIEFGLRERAISAGPAGMVTAMIAYAPQILAFRVGAPVLALLVASSLVPRQPIRLLLGGHSMPR